MPHYGWNRQHDGWKLYQYEQNPNNKYPEPQPKTNKMRARRNYLGQLCKFQFETRPRRPGFKDHPIEFMIVLEPYLGPLWIHLNQFGPIRT